ncbi:Uncharacterised protein [Streptococcus dysgalactiae subsp. dysgalactiae]|uniref:hypothetical protein n=1 Tax=Streptococcus dysgalactiae TaxID=1334 RepID=UPI000F6ED66E|nr:hypothetical protein [Streptococcus dysgalactiae]VDZ39830.1 Uncharacterised protein [Streptococcus dysgalactiae subsp. dysgalactiae]
MAIAIGRFGLGLKDAERLTWHDYCVYDLAYQVKMQEQETMLAKQAWFNQAVKATKGSGKNIKPAYENFNDFYNAEKSFASVFGAVEEAKRLTIADLNRVINQEEV